MRRSVKIENHILSYIKSFALPVLLLFLAFNISAQTVPANDDYKNAEKIIIGNNGYGPGTFQSTKVNLAKATKEAGESIHLLQYFAGTDKKTVWFVFETAVTRSVNIELRQQDTLISQDAVGITVYKSNSKTQPPNLGEVDKNLPPISKFGSTINTCLTADRYYVQVSAKQNVSGEIWLNITVNEPSPAPFDHRKDAYEFGTLSGKDTVKFDVGCQGIENKNELMKSLGDDYSQSVWLTFNSDNYTDLLKLNFYAGQSYSGQDTTKIGYRLYKGNAKNASDQLTQLDSTIFIQTCFSRYGNYFCSSSLARRYFCQIEPNETYTIQLIFYKYTKCLMTLITEEVGTKPSATADPKNLPLAYRAGALNPNGVGYVFKDHFACNSIMTNNLCGTVNLPQVVDSNFQKRPYFYYYDNKEPDTFDMALWMTFEIYENGYILINNTKYFCISGYPERFLFRIFKGDVTKDCNLPLAWQTLYKTYEDTFCVSPGVYSLQVLGKQKGAANYYRCINEDIGKDINVIVQFYRRATETPAVHYKPSNPEDLGDITARLQTGLKSAPDYFGSPDDSIYIDGQKYLNRFIFRQFYISEPKYITISSQTAFGYNVLFSGRISQGVDSVKKLDGSRFGTSIASSRSFRSGCEPLPAGWYTIMSYLDLDCRGIQGMNRLNLNSFEKCSTVFDRPYKAKYEGDIDWFEEDPSINHYTFTPECHSCSPDAPFSNHPIDVCKVPGKAPFTKVTYHVFNLKQESSLHIFTTLFDENKAKLEFGTVQLYKGDVRIDSLHFKDDSRLITSCDSFNMFCRLQPGVYTLAIFASKPGVFETKIRVEKSGYSKYDHASKAADLGHIPANKNVYSDEDLILCTTGAQYTDPNKDYNYFYTYLKYKTSVPYPMPENKVITREDLTYEKYKKNLWYTFTCAGSGDITVTGDLLTGGNYNGHINLRIYKSDEKYFGPYKSVVAAGKSDSTELQGLERINYSLYGDSYEAKFSKIGCDTVRYYVILEYVNNNGYALWNSSYDHNFQNRVVRLRVKYENVFFDGERGDYCTNAEKLVLNKPGEVSLSTNINCHTKGESFGEDGSNMSCLVRDTLKYKTTWFKFTYSGSQNAALSFRVQANTNAQFLSGIHYRVLYGTCDAMTPGPCVENINSYFKLDCMGPGDYYIQVVTPAEAGGKITLFAKAEPTSYDICKPIELLKPMANFSFTGGCNGQPVKFINLSSAGSNISYAWNFDNGTTSTEKTPSVIFKAKQLFDTFRVTLRVTNNKTLKYDELTLPVVVFRDPITLTLAEKEITIGCNDKVQLEASTNYPFATYEWNPKNGLSNPYSPTPVFTHQNTDAKFILTMRAENCDIKDTVHIYLRPKILISGDSMLCFGGKGFLKAADGYKNYSWSNGETTQQIEVDKPGKYRVVGTTNSGCRAVDSFVVKDGSAGIVYLGKDVTICPEENIVLKSALPGKNHLWSTGETTPQITANKPGKYWLKMDDDFCSGYDTIEISHKPKPFVELDDTVYLCGGNAVWVDITKPGQEYIWSHGSTYGQLFLKKPGKYFVQIKENGCVSTDSVVVEPADLPVMNLKDTAFCSDFSFTIDAGNWEAYHWQPGNFTARELTVNTFGQYVVKVSNKQGCKNSDTINISQECYPQIWVPNAFTPFNDEPNNVFKAVTHDVFSVEMKIYNRWGELVFETDDLNKGWDGTFNGKPCTMDMYVWTINYKGLRTNKYIYGTVSLLR